VTALCTILSPETPCLTFAGRELVDAKSRARREPPHLRFARRGEVRGCAVSWEEEGADEWKMEGRGQGQSSEGRGGVGKHPFGYE